VYERIEQVFAWGLCVGLANPKTTVPTKVTEFEHENVQSRLGSLNDVYELHFDQVKSAAVSWLIV